MSSPQPIHKLLVRCWPCLTLQEDQCCCRNFDARNEKIETGAGVTNRRCQRGVERGQGECYQWKAKGQCSRGDKCSFRHDEDKRAKSTPKTAPPSEPPTQRDGRSASRKRNLRGQSPSGKTNRQRCRDFLKGTCINVNSISLNRDVSSAQSAYSLTGRLKSHQTKSRKRVTTCDSWVACHRTLSRQNLLRFHGRARKFWDQFDEYDSQGLRCVKQTSEKIKFRRWVKYESTVLINERLQDKSDAPAETRGDLPRISVSSKRKTKLHSIRLTRSGFCQPHPQ